MLIVTRSLQQSVIVGEFGGLELAIKITVLGIRGTKVRLGIDVLSDEPNAASESWERIPYVRTSPAFKPGMATTQEVDWGIGRKMREMARMKRSTTITAPFPEMT